jgi:integrase
LSGNSILHYHRLISSILTTAVEWQIILSNPAERARAPRAEKKEAKYLDDVEARQLIKLLDIEPIQYRTMVTLLIFSGLRRGELCGIKWSDIDFASGLMHVQRAVQYLPGKGLFEVPPKRGSQRVIKLPSVALRLLLEHKNAQAAEAKACGDQWQENALVFTRWNGTYFNPDDLTQWFNAFIQRNGLKKATPHSLRHTNATLMIAAGTDLRTVSKRLGHVQTSTTSNIYAHAIRSADEAASETLENILDPVNRTIIEA